MGSNTYTNDPAPYEDNILHDINIPLCSIKMNLDLLRSSKDNKYINRALIAYQELDLLLNDKRSLVLNRSNRSSVIECLNEVLNIFSSYIESMNIKIVKDYRLDNNILNKEYLKRILINIIKNSIRSLNDIDNRMIIIKTYRSYDSFIILIKDNGKGFDKRLLPNIFDPDINSRKGLLNVKYLINRYYKGKVVLSNDNGAVVKLIFPNR